MKEDAVLDPAVCFDNALPENAASRKAFFLTGATGFIGCFLLDELLRKTDADIYCLIRGTDSDAARQRIGEQLEFYALWQDGYDERIIPVAGDLSQSRFGLSEYDFLRLAEKTDIIYHSAAKMNPWDSYEQMKTTNVSGTQELLCFAGIRRVKSFHYISTLGIFSNTYNKADRFLRETEMPVCDEGLTSGYCQSKWVAEQLVIQAGDRGLPICIYRPDIALWHSRTGIINPGGHFLCNVLLACIQCGKFPSIETTVSFVPVDYASRSIVHLSRQNQSYGKIFHIANPDTVSWQSLGAEISAMGYALEEVAYEDWVYEIMEQSARHPENRLFSIIRNRLALKLPIYLFSEKPQINASNTYKRLADTSIVCPRIDRNLLAVYLNRKMRGSEEN
ncbi:MAG: NAD-dependent epimerase/dehydratase family protein [Desulfobacterales bacterium]|nr:NAD-dependent epimerase/dehydratase family protein [Desulfobacterales bacterium]